MSEKEHSGSTQDPPQNERESDPITGLLQNALASPPLPRKSLLPGIQQRIYVRTRGRYFRNHRRDTKDPTILVLGAALLLLALAAALFFGLYPLMSHGGTGNAETPHESDSGERPTIERSP